jgi:ABC-type Zn uptake system ZnuABC Zn-binding protein ZnuA
MVAREAGVPVRGLDPVATGSTSLTTYEDVMRDNLRVLQEVLGK